jgi:hypothetical protein
MAAAALMPGPGSIAVPKPEPRVYTARAKRLTLAQQERACRAAVKARDKGRCRVPNCNERATDLHHVIFRSKSKASYWQTGNLASLCGAHHRLVHAHRIQISGDADGELIITGDRKDLAFKL